MDDSESKGPKDIVRLDEDQLDKLRGLWELPFVQEMRERLLPTPIPNNKLTPDLIPTRSSTLAEVWRFALTFNGYDEWGSFEKCADVGPAHPESTLTELRTVLFFEQRCWNHFGTDPDELRMGYVNRVLQQIRGKVENGELA